MKVKISDLTLADDVNIRDGLREEAVERYMEILDDLPPVEAWKSDGKSLLSDGWHRIAAATRLGRDEIEADIHEGGRTEAIVAAIVANTKHGIPLSTKERNRGIVRLAAAGWGQRKIARTLGLALAQIQRILGADTVPGHLPHREEIIRAPREYRLPVGEAALAGGWTQKQTREIAQRLNDPGIAKEDKEKIVREVMVRQEDGQVGVPAALVAEVLRDAKERAASPAIYEFTAAAAKLLGKLRIDPDPLGGLGSDAFPGILRGLEDAEVAVGIVRDLIEAVR